jgi:hypothetical protein
MATRLTVLRGEALAAETTFARVPSLESQPFRPGELPESVLIELGPMATVAEERAARAGIPTELWLRLGVEAVRHIDLLAELLNVERREVVAALDAGADVWSAVAPLETRRQRAYAQHLRAASPRPASRPARTPYSLAIPDMIVSAWSVAATTAGETISEYVAARVDDAPDGLARWEAAAAELGRSLGEWIYVEGLRSLRPR